MKFIYQYPETYGADDDMLDPGPISSLAIAAEESGWHGFAFTEHPVPSSKWLASGGHQSLDPFVALGHVAAVTRHLRLLTYLAVLPYRNPFLLAKSAATLDRLSGGRFILGIGAGYLKSEFRALGVDFDERNALFDEALEVLPLYWEGEPFSYEGRHFSAREVISRPKLTGGGIPIWIGGNSQLTRKRVAAQAQGWMPLMAFSDISATTRSPHLGSLDDLAAMIAEVRAGAKERGAEIEVVVSYTDLSIVRPDDDAERHRDKIAEFESIGATWMVVPAPTTVQPETQQFIEAFARNYISP